MTLKVYLHTSYGDSFSPMMPDYYDYEQYERVAAWFRKPGNDVAGSTFVLSETPLDDNRDPLIKIFYLFGIAELSRLNKELGERHLQAEIKEIDGAVPMYEDGCLVGHKGIRIRYVELFSPAERELGPSGS